MPAIVVGITPEDYAPYGEGPLAGIALQRHWEARAFELGGGDYEAPATTGRRFPRRSRIAAIRHGAAVVHAGRAPGRPRTHALPDYAIDAIREALPAFDKQIRGFAMDDAVLTGVETRTSSPLRITRGEDGHSLNTRGLFPAGEGAGYAGGILSAGVDGIRSRGSGRAQHPQRRLMPARQTSSEQPDFCSSLRRQESSVFGVWGFKTLDPCLRRDDEQTRLGDIRCNQRLTPAHSRKNADRSRPDATCIARCRSAVVAVVPMCAGYTRARPRQNTSSPSCSRSRCIA